jgi:energy-coupling factor transporter ATP-binding protein EcfA2
MNIARLRISGFRGLKSADLRFGQQAVLIGPNGCGKSTVVDALSLVLGRTKMVRPLTEHDFSGSDPVPASRITIVATLTGFSSGLAEDHEDWFQHGRGVPKWIDGKGTEFAEPGAGRQLSVNVGFAARFDRDELEVATVRYFHDDDDTTDPFADEGAIVPVPSRLLNEVGYFVLPARRDWDAIASFNSDLFRRTVSNLAGIPADEIIVQRDALRNPATKIEESAKLKGLVDGLNNRLARLAPTAPKFGLRVTAGDSEAVLQSLLPHYATAAGMMLPAARHGAGLVSLQSLLLLLEIGQARLKKGLSFILALEEPELHLSPGIHGRLVAEAIAIANQVVCTTHSPEVARVFDATAVLVASNEAGKFAAGPLLAQPLTPAATNNERKLYLLNRSSVVSALMRPHVLVPEGRFDAEWLARFSEVADPYTADTAPFGAMFGVIPTENAAVVFTTERLAPLRPRVLAMVDGDVAGDGYVADLLKKKLPTRLIIQLPTAWTIEDIVRWMLDPGGHQALAALKAGLPDYAFATLDLFRDLLKTQNAAGQVGLKENVLAHEIVAGVLDELPACRARVVEFCQALVSAATGLAHARIAADGERSTADTRVVRFVP